MLSNETGNVFAASKLQATGFLFGLAQRALLGAELQMSRIWKPRSSIVNERQLLDAYELTLIDVHFFFISIRNLYRYLDKIVRDPTYEFLRKELDLLNERWFRHYSSGREALEHIDQRLPGERHEDRIVETEIKGVTGTVHYMLKWNEGLFLHSDKQWDISIPTFMKLKADVTALFAKVEAISLSTES